MCSTGNARLSLIGQAIDEVAAAAREAGGNQAGLDGLAQRVAEIWAMVAEIDPVLAGRLPGYWRTGQ